MKTLSTVAACLIFSLIVGMVAYNSGLETGEVAGYREAQRLMATGELAVSQLPDAPVVIYGAAKGRGHGWALRCQHWEPVEVKGPERHYDRSQYIDCPG